MRSWTREVMRRAMGGVPADPADGDWPSTPSPSAAAWSDALESLHLAHTALTALIRGMTEAQLAEKVKAPPSDPLGAALSRRSMIGSLAEHDIYHSAQVAMLKRLARSPH